MKRNRIKSRLARVWRSLRATFALRNPLRVRCIQCGCAFIAEPHHFVESGVTYDGGGDPSGFIPESERREMAEVFSQLGYDAETIDRILELAPGETLDTGVFPWCDDCRNNETENITF